MIENLMQKNNANDRKKIDCIIKSTGLDYDEFSIEEFWSAIEHLERTLNFQYIRMDFGVPGLTPPETSLSAHQQTFQHGQIPQQYPPYSGVPQLTAAMAEFIGNRLNTKISSRNIFVTCGATQALFVAQAVAAKLKAKANSVAFLTPNYPPMCTQARFLGMEISTIEVDYRKGVSLIGAIRTVFETGKVAAFCWASPSNPSWRVLNDEELLGIANLCKEFNVIPIEDLTYIGMIDSTNNVKQVCLPSIARYADDYLLVLSTSKMLSYAGERIGFLVGSDSLLDKKSNSLKAAFEVNSVRRACGSLIFNTTGGAPHSAQYAVTSIIKAINRGDYDLDKALSIYLKRAKKLKQLLNKHGFYLIYSQNNDEDLNGFYVSFAYPGLSEMELLQELLYLGVTVLPLSIFGSQRRDGVRACVGRLSEDKLDILEERLVKFVGARND